MNCYDCKMVGTNSMVSLVQQNVNVTYKKLYSVELNNFTVLVIYIKADPNVIFVRFSSLEPNENIIIILEIYPSKRINLRIKKQLVIHPRDSSLEPGLYFSCSTGYDCTKLAKTG